MNKFLVVMFLFFSYQTVNAAPIYVEHDWLTNRLDDKNIVLVDMTADGVQYLRYHIPGAVRLSYQDIVVKRKDKVSVRVPDARLYKVLASLGITRDKHIVIYDDMGGLEAGRLFWELERIGHPAVSVLRGGLVKWVLAGHPVDNKPVKPIAAQYEAGKPKRNNEAVLDNIRNNASSLLLDVRSIDEYVGHPRYPRSGHIPGAKWWPWEANVDFANGFVPRSDDVLQSELTKLGVKDKTKPLILYCRSGHRASQSYLTLRSLGYTDVKLYDGSMAEYASKRELPLQKAK